MGRWITALLVVLALSVPAWSQPAYVPASTQWTGSAQGHPTEYPYPPRQWVDQPAETYVIPQHYEGAQYSPTAYTPGFVPKSQFRRGSSFFDQDTYSDELLWVRAEYLLWFLEGATLPPLLTESPAGTPPQLAGLPSTPGTRTIFGDDKVNDGFRSGYRIRAGIWLDECKTVGLEGGFFQLANQSSGVTITPNDNRILARPFTNALTNEQDAQIVSLQDSQLISYPGLVNGTTTFDAGTSGLLGADIYFREPWCGCCKPCGVRFDGLLGYRHFRFDEHVNIREDLNPLSSAFVPGTRIIVVDEFRTENTFHGVLLGCALDYRQGPWSMELLAKADVGQLSRRSTIFGHTRIETPGAATVDHAGGILAQTTNMGTIDSNDWIVIPELEFNLGYNITPHLRLLVGYTLIYLHDFARAADLIDTTVNPNLIPPATNGGAGPARPAFMTSRSDIWVQGFNFGIELRY